MISDIIGTTTCNTQILLIITLMRLASIYVLMCLLTSIGYSTKFTLTIPGLEKKCFYEMLGILITRYRINPEIFIGNNTQE